MKYRVLKRMHRTPYAPISYSCFALEFLDQMGCYLYKSNFDVRTSSEKLYGQTPDIRFFFDLLGFRQSSNILSIYLFLLTR